MGTIGEKKSQICGRSGPWYKWLCFLDKSQHFDFFPRKIWSSHKPIGLGKKPTSFFFFLPFLQKQLLLHLYGLWHPSYVGETLILHFTLTFSCAGCCKRYWVGSHEDLKICPKFHIRRQPNYKKCKIDRYFSLLNYCFTVCHIILTIFYPQYKVYHIGIWYSLLKICWSIRLDVLQSIELEQAKWYSQILYQYFLNFLGFEIFFINNKHVFINFSCRSIFPEMEIDFQGFSIL